MSLQQACSQSNVVGINAWRRMRNNFFCQSIIALPSWICLEGFHCFPQKGFQYRQSTTFLGWVFWGNNHQPHLKQSRNTSGETKQSQKQYGLPLHRFFLPRLPLQQPLKHPWFHTLPLHLLARWFKGGFKNFWLGCQKSSMHFERFIATN